MHAFMSLNMIGAAFMAPIVGHLSDRRAWRAGLWVRWRRPTPFSSPSAASIAGTGGARPANPRGRSARGSATLLIAALAAHGTRGGAPWASAERRSWPRSPRARRSAARCFASTSPRRSSPVRLGRRGCDLRAAAGRRRAGAGDGAADHPRALAPGARPLGTARAAFAARFSIGCLIVTFALLVHARPWPRRHDHRLLFSSMLVPFAAATYPASRLARGPAACLGAGAAVWGACLFALGWAPTAALFPLMIAGGLASALVFAPILGYAARAPGAGEAHALVNAAGCLGMLLGPASAGYHHRDPEADGSARGRLSRPIRARRGLDGRLLAFAARWIARRRRLEADEIGAASDPASATRRSVLSPRHDCCTATAAPATFYKILLALAHSTAPSRRSRSTSSAARAARRRSSPRTPTGASR